MAEKSCVQNRLDQLVSPVIALMLLELKHDTTYNTTLRTNAHTHTHTRQEEKRMEERGGAPGAGVKGVLVQVHTDTHTQGGGSQKKYF